MPVYKGCCCMRCSNADRQWDRGHAGFSLMPLRSHFASLATRAGSAATRNQLVINMYVANTTRRLLWAEWVEAEWAEVAWVAAEWAEAEWVAWAACKPTCLPTPSICLTWISCKT